MLSRKIHKTAFCVIISLDGKMLELKLKPHLILGELNRNRLGNTKK
ncbi:MAG: hypothetical protein ACJAWV_003582 [Flammeovirgaceae bacterium]|jgi:hypothetical protein